MRICMISGNTGFAGGVNNVVYELSKVLTKNEHQVTIFNIVQKI